MGESPKYQPEELFTLHFIKLGDDVSDGVLNLRNDHMLYGVDAPIGHFDGFVQSDEARLQLVWSTERIKHIKPPGKRTCKVANSTSNSTALL